MNGGAFCSDKSVMGLSPVPPAILNTFYVSRVLQRVLAFWEGVFDYHVVIVIACETNHLIPMASHVKACHASQFCVPRVNR